MRDFRSVHDLAEAFRGRNRCCLLVVRYAPVAHRVFKDCELRGLSGPWRLFGRRKLFCLRALPGENPILGVHDELNAMGVAASTQRFCSNVGLFHGFKSSSGAPSKSLLSASQSSDSSRYSIEPTPYNRAIPHVLLIRYLPLRAPLPLGASLPPVVRLRSGSVWPQANRLGTPLTPWPVRSGSNPGRA